MKLSIAVVTMNRERQLLEALQSCVECDLPEDTQFVIIDNASSDGTESAIANFFGIHHFEYYYEKLPRNIGCGNGRNYAYLKSKGEYVYFLDDDAYIDKNCRHFFKTALEIFENNNKIATLTTQIYDLMWQKNRISHAGPEMMNGIKYCYILCGGSHFLARSFFQQSHPYFPNKYGYEEILPSLRVMDSGYVNAFVENLRVIHNPLFNKWDYSVKTNEEYLIKDITISYVMKSKYYPKIFSPLIYFAYRFRCKYYLNKSQMLRSREMIVEMGESYLWGDRIKATTVYKMFKYFGCSIF